MGSYNILHTSMTCPRCGITVEGTIDCHFGATSHMTALKIGDKYPWVPRVQPQNGGRPPNGNTDGEGYAECEHCKKDSFFKIIIRDDIIVSIEPETGRPGCIPD